MKIYVASTSPKCQACEGCGKVSDTEEPEPWTAWASLPAGADLAVRMGMVKPKTCPSCGGSGEAPHA